MINNKQDDRRKLLLRFAILVAVATLSLVACLPTRVRVPEPRPLENIPRDSRLIAERKFGVFVPEAAWKASSTVLDLEAKLDYEFDIIHWFTDWTHDFERIPVEKAFALGRAPLITWQANKPSLKAIKAGDYDAFIRRWAKDSAELKGEIYVRIFPEMNGDWTSWHGEPELFKEVWIHIVQLFREEANTNVKWVWTPNVTNEPDTALNAFENYYPGDTYVDIVGLDGYNWGTVNRQTRWTYFESLFAEAYLDLVALADKPIWIAEIASTEQGGNKAVWIEDMLRSNAFPRIEALIWFNEQKETDWRLESSEDALTAFKTNIDLKLEARNP